MIFENMIWNMFIKYVSVAILKKKKMYEWLYFVFLYCHST